MRLESGIANKEDTRKTMTDATTTKTTKAPRIGPPATWTPMVYVINNKQEASLFKYFNDQDIYLEDIMSYLDKKSLKAFLNGTDLRGVKGVLVLSERRGLMPHKPFSYAKDFVARHGDQPIFGDAIIRMTDRAYQQHPARHLDMKDLSLIQTPEKPMEKPVEKPTLSLKKKYNDLKLLEISTNKQLREALASLSPQDMMAMMTYTLLPYEQLWNVLSWKSKEWLNYSTLKEYEYYENRTDEDKSSNEKHPFLYCPNDKREDACVLSESLFHKKNTNDTLTFLQYTNMRQFDFTEERLQTVSE